RRAHLDGHLDYVERWHDRYLVAGPLRRPNGPDLVGSLFVVRAESEDDARRFLGDDPYFSSGVFQSIIVRAFTPAAGAWMGGVIWDSADSLRPIADGRLR
ncbi:MAG: YciI family protein, partial [Parvularculaceae bacterium]|nr:YciI family protein [Parvularculaceae bacterium]